MEIHDDCLSKIVKKEKPIIKPPTIKDCLQPKGISHFEQLMVEIRSNFILKITNDKEPGKTCFETSNLPPHIDPTYTSFGQRQRYPFSLADIIHQKDNYDLSKGLNRPGEQINRKYKKPFSKYKIYGRVSKADVNGNKVKKLLYFSTEPNKYSNYDELNKLNAPQNLMPDKLSGKSHEDIYETLHETPLNEEILQMKKCFSHVNSIRFILKKRVPEVSFSGIKNLFNCINNNSSDMIDLNKFYAILRRIRIILDKENFDILFKKLNLIKEESIYFEKAIDLLNWKYEFPEIRIDDVPTDPQHFRTTYQELMSL